MSEMFCNEPIIAVYEGCREYDDIDGADAFFDCFHELAYHVTEGYRIILETENTYISLDIHGATKISKTGSIQELEQPGEWIEPFIHKDEDDELPWINYQYTLFVGERLIQVAETNGYFLLTFDDFEFKIIPHNLDEKDFPWLDRRDIGSYFRVLGSERHIVKECSCGGDGELLLDFVCDYVVRCKKCNRSTWAQMCACEAIEEWNNGELHCDLSDIIIE